MTGGEAILFDSARDRGGLPEAATLARLVVRFPEGSPDPRGLDPGLELRVFVDDPTTPRARVRLADLVRRRGERPLNLRVGPGQAVRIVLADPAGAGRAGRPDRGRAGLVRTTAAPPGKDDLGPAAPVPIGRASAGAGHAAARAGDGGGRDAGPGAARTSPPA